MSSMLKKKIHVMHFHEIHKELKISLQHGDSAVWHGGAVVKALA